MPKKRESRARMARRVKNTDLLLRAWALLLAAQKALGRKITKEEVGRLSRITEMADRMMHPKDLPKFLWQPHSLLGGRVPGQLIATEEGTKEVLLLLEGAESGSFT